MNVIGSDALGSRQWKSIFPQAAAPAAPLLAASISSILIPSAANSTCTHGRNGHDSRRALHSRTKSIFRSGVSPIYLEIEKLSTSVFPYRRERDRYDSNLAAGCVSTRLPATTLSVCNSNAERRPRKRGDF